MFLDRDGTINKYVGFLRSIDDFQLLPGAAEAIRIINQSGYLAIVMTNQPVIARGKVTEEQFREIHNKMAPLLGLEGAYIDALYYCPHHPHRGLRVKFQSSRSTAIAGSPSPGCCCKQRRTTTLTCPKAGWSGTGSTTCWLDRRRGAGR